MFVIQMVYIFLVDVKLNIIEIMLIVFFVFLKIVIFVGIWVFEQKDLLISFKYNQFVCCVLKLLVDFKLNLLVKFGNFEFCNFMVSEMLCL